MHRQSVNLIVVRLGTSSSESNQILSVCAADNKRDSSETIFRRTTSKTNLPNLGTQKLKSQRRMVYNINSSFEYRSFLNITVTLY